MEVGVGLILLQRVILELVAADLDCDWELLAGQIMTESSGDPDAIGDNGHAFGLAQIWLPTAYNHKFAQEWQGVDLLDVDKNMKVYRAEMHRLSNWLKKTYDIYDARWVLVCWNYGCGNVEVHLDKGLGWEDLPEVARMYPRLCEEKAKMFKEEKDDIPKTE